MSALANVDEHGPLRLSDLAVVEASTCSLQRGLVEWQSDPRDGRSALLALTPSGADVLAEWRAARSALLADRLNQLDPADLDRLAAALPVLHGLVDALADARTLAGRLAADPPSAPLKESPGIPGQGPDETRGQGRCRPGSDQMSK